MHRRINAYEKETAILELECEWHNYSVKSKIEWVQMYQYQYLSVLWLETLLRKNPTLDNIKLHSTSFK